jgi:hypothetical protein
VVKRECVRAALAALSIAWALSASSAASAAGQADTLKSEIDGFIHRTEASTGGNVHWGGADSFDVREDGDAAVATLTNARFSVRLGPASPKPSLTIVLDRVEIRRKPISGGALVEFSIALPGLTKFTPDQGPEIDLTLTDASTDLSVEEPAERQRAMTLRLSGARIGPRDGADVATLGPVTSSWKLVRGAKGDWSAPASFDARSIGFLMTKAQIAGTIDHIAYTGEATGPSLAALDALRDRFESVRDEPTGDPAKRAELLAMLPQIFDAFASSKGEVTVEGTAVKRPGGETLFTLTKATFGGSLGGLDSDKAALRIALSHDGLAIAPTLLPDAQVPRHAAIDLCLEEIATAPLRQIVEALGRTGPGVAPAEQQKAFAQVIGAAMGLAPVFRIHDLTVEFKDTTIHGTAELRRAGPLPIGYAGSGDVTVRGFDGLMQIVTGHAARERLPLIKFLGTDGKAPDGTTLTSFHLGSASGRPLSVNGNDISGWFAAGPPPGMAPGSPRVLRLADPPLSGDDVREVQKAVAATEVEPFAPGIYDTATALAVARFQKKSGMNISGVVDAATRQKLGLTPPPAPPAPKH